MGHHHTYHDYRKGPASIPLAMRAPTLDHARVSDRSFPTTSHDWPTWPTIASIAWFFVPKSVFKQWQPNQKLHEPSISIHTATTINNPLIGKTIFVLERSPPAWCSSCPPFSNRRRQARRTPEERRAHLLEADASLLGQLREGVANGPMDVRRAVVTQGARPVPTGAHLTEYVQARPGYAEKNEER